MKVEFVGGPLDGSVREVPDNTAVWRVPMKRPSDWTPMWKPMDDEIMQSQPAFSVGEYTFSWATYKMHWREPK